MFRLIFASVMITFGLQAQTPVNVNPFVVNSVPSVVNYFDGSGNLIYICSAHPIVNYTPITAVSASQQYQWSIPKSTLVSINVASNVGTVTTSTANGVQVGNLVQVTGSTTATSLNTTYVVQSITSPTAFVITTSGVSDNIYTDAALTVGTQAPLLTQPVWSIQKLTYNGSNQLINIQQSIAVLGQYTQICANRAVTTGATKIYYH